VIYAAFYVAVYPLDVLMTLLAAFCGILVFFHTKSLFSAEIALPILRIDA
jgi:hypothetical protein